MKSFIQSFLRYIGRKTYTFGEQIGFGWQHEGSQVQIALSIQVAVGFRHFSYCVELANYRRFALSDNAAPQLQVIRFSL